VVVLGPGLEAQQAERAELDHGPGAELEAQGAGRPERPSGPNFEHEEQQVKQLELQLGWYPGPQEEPEVKEIDEGKVTGWDL
jgi:hypothetical protein